MSTPDWQVYSICVNVPGCLPEQDPTYVVGLSTAREIALSQIDDDFTEQAGHLIAQAEEMTGRGAVIGPLPDGYVVDVSSVDFDVSAFVDGYVECALWADCMPADRCEECGEFMEYVPGAIAGREWTHAEREDSDPGCSGQHDENAETGGCEGLELRPGARERMAVDCLDFVAAELPDLLEYCATMGQWFGMDSRGEPAEARAGHDFWLTRSGHGTGFWDRGLGELGDRLTAASKIYGSPDDHTPFDCGDGTADV